MTVKRPSFRVIGLILSSDNHSNIELFIKVNGIDALFEMLKITNMEQFETEILWSLSNITAGSESQIAKFL